MREYRNDELTAGWVQPGVFSPMMRLHSSMSERMLKEPWLYGRECERAMTEMIRFRHTPDPVPVLHEPPRGDSWRTAGPARVLEMARSQRGPPVQRQVLLRHRAARRAHHAARQPIDPPRRRQGVAAAEQTRRPVHRVRVRQGPHADAALQPPPDPCPHARGLHPAPRRVGPACERRPQPEGLLPPPRRGQKRRDQDRRGRRARQSGRRAHPDLLRPGRGHLGHRPCPVREGPYRTVAFAPRVEAAPPTSTPCRPT